MWNVYPALMALRGVDEYLGDNALGIVTITQKDADEDGDGFNDYAMIFEESPDGYCQYQQLSSEDQLREDMKWVKKYNTDQETVSPIIHP